MFEEEFERWEDEGGSNAWDDEFEYLEDDECPRCGEVFEQPGSPCQVCGYDPLYD